MSRITTPLQLYKHLPKTNCGGCGASTCLAFAAAVIKQEKRLDDCPYLDRDTIARLETVIEQPVSIEGVREDQLKELRRKIENVDIVSRAAVLGARISGQNILIACLGREFEVDPRGNVLSQCHTHAWFSLPLLDYVLHSRGVALSGRWVPFRELENGRTWNPLFERRCEKPLNPQRSVRVPAQPVERHVVIRSFPCRHLRGALSASAGAGPHLLLETGGWHGVEAPSLF